MSVLGDLEAAPSFGARLGELAVERPDYPAVIFVSEAGEDSTITFVELDRRSNQVARSLATLGLGQDDRVAVALRNSPEHLYTCFGAWKLGAVPVPMRWDLPDWERSRILEAMSPRLVVDEAHLELFTESLDQDDGALEDRVSPHGWGVCSGGATGTPKVILMKFPARHFGGSFNHIVERWGPVSEDQRVLIPAPLYHTNGFTCLRNILCGKTNVLLEKFDAELLIDVIERQRVTGFIAATPFLQRLLKVEGVERARLQLDRVDPARCRTAARLARSEDLRAHRAGALLHELRCLRGPGPRGLPRRRVSSAPWHPGATHA